MFLLWHTESKSVTVTMVTWLPLVIVSKDTKDLRCGTLLQTRMQYDKTFSSDFK